LSRVLRDAAATAYVRLESWEWEHDAQIGCLGREEVDPMLLVSNILWSIWACETHGEQKQQLCSLYCLPSSCPSSFPIPSSSIPLWISLKLSSHPGAPPK
jgi:hypothetical protein